MVNAWKFCVSGWLVTVLVLTGGSRILTDPRQQPDLQNLAIGFIGTALGVSLIPIWRD